jgi:hypothetical protein
MLSTVIVLLTILSTAFTFSPNFNGGKQSMLKSSQVDISEMETEVKPKQSRLVQWLPFGGLKAPEVLDGSLPGDVGFDPIGFAKDKSTLYWMREAEIKHSRLAMLAAIGWPLSELWHKNIASILNLQPVLAGPNADRAPSVLNGGLSNLWVFSALLATIIASAALEARAMQKEEVFWGNEKPADYVPGDLGFDPLNLYNIRGNQKGMQQAEIKNGRLAMIAITAYVFQEVASGLPVVKETPFLF